jgi:hypothetical protein
VGGRERKCGKEKTMDRKIMIRNRKKQILTYR